MCTCVHKKCQFESFFEIYNDKTVYYVKNNEKLNKDEYCLFHAPENLKENFTYYQNDLLKKIIDDYIYFCSKEEEKRDIDFSNAVFTIPFEVYDAKVPLLNINFTETIFIEYFRMDNLHCKEIIFKDTEFHDGGGIKNRGGAKEVNIEKLIFRPYQLESDFVIDIGKYANSDGLIESDKYGIIKNIRFENHKVGSGIIYFIGLNTYTEEANFRNMILDNVSFQNCDLGKCYFLNAKIDKTEFRNCEFLNHMDEIDYNSALNIKNWFYRYSIGISVLITLFYLASRSITFFLIIILLLVILFPKLNNALLKLLILSLGMLWVSRSKRIVTNDEVLIKNNLKNVDEGNKNLSLISLENIYRSLKENIGKNDFQTSGDFFYSQRTIQIMTTSHEYQKMLFLFHYIINGFGERFIRPIVWFIITILVFSFNYTVDKDFIGTNATPRFLIYDYDKKIKNIDKSCSPFVYSLQLYIDENNNSKQRAYTSLLFGASSDSNNTKKYDFSFDVSTRNFNIYITTLVYSASQFISPFTSKNKSWFKTINSQAMLMNLIEMVLLYLFFGAFILALKNRIKR